MDVRFVKLTAGGVQTAGCVQAEDGGGAAVGQLDQVAGAAGGGAAPSFSPRSFHVHTMFIFSPRSFHVHTMFIPRKDIILRVRSPNQLIP